MKFAVYAGHGGSDPGAVYGRRKEKDYTLSLMKAVTECLKAAGQTVMNNRSGDVDSFIKDKTAQANAANVDAVIELHLNAGGGTGSEVYYDKVGKSKNLAQAILDPLIAFGYKSRGIKTRLNDTGNDYFAIIRDSKAPCVLVESCFLDHDGDMIKFNADTVGQAIAKGIMQAYSIKPHVRVASDGKCYRVQVGAYSVQENAIKMAEKLQKLGFEAYIAESQEEGK